MTDQTVRVSIGIPVYNGENYLEAAIESFLIISDDASSDRTEEICREYLTKAQRIRYQDAVESLRLSSGG